MRAVAPAGAPGPAWGHVEVHAVRRARFLRRARARAAEQGQVLSRPQLYALGITRWQVRGEVRARRWQLIGDQSVCLHNGPVEALGHQWAAVVQGGPRACLDGA